MPMQLNPYSAVKNLPSSERMIAGLLSSAGQSQGRMGENLLGAVDKLRGVGIAGENEKYNKLLGNLQASPEFASANPMEKQRMIQSVGQGLELDKQNIAGQKSLFENLRDEQTQLNAQENIGLKVGADQALQTEKISANESLQKDRLKEQARQSDLNRKELGKQVFNNDIDINGNSWVQLKDGTWKMQDSKGSLFPTGKSGEDSRIKGSKPTETYMGEQVPNNRPVIQAMIDTGIYRAFKEPVHDKSGKKIGDKWVHEVLGPNGGRFNSHTEAQEALGLGSKKEQTKFNPDDIPNQKKKETSDELEIKQFIEETNKQKLFGKAGINPRGKERKNYVPSVEELVRPAKNWGSRR